VPPQSPAAPQVQTELTIGDFQRLALRIGRIVSAEAHPNADRLLVLQVDIGEAAPRQVVAGIKASYEPSALVGKHVVVVANLKAASLRGVTSQGMVLAASDDTGIVLVSSDRPVRPGSTVK
jgi:methionyl-tRNA synthetase